MRPRPSKGSFYMKARLHIKSIHSSLLFQVTPVVNFVFIISRTMNSTHENILFCFCFFHIDKVIFDLDLDICLDSRLV